MVKSKINEDISQVMTSWINRIGRREAIRRLVLAGLSPNLASSLASDSYFHELRFETKEMILNAIRKEAV